MSSEESCEDEAVEPVSGPKPRKIRKLSWEAPVPFFFPPLERQSLRKFLKGINDWDRRESCLVLRSQIIAKAAITAISVT